MNRLLLLTGLLLPAALVSSAQSEVASTRIIQLQYLGNDSVHMFYNGKYQLIEDSCATIVRYAHYDSSRQKFYGKFTDLTTDSPIIVVTEGAYNDRGLKDGVFTAHYLNGKLHSKISYKDDRLAGRGEIDYPDGKPKLIFEADDAGISILDAWDAGGKKMVDSGKGNYKITQGLTTWSGKIANGRPDGNWEASLTYNPSNSKLLSEKFKDNKFIRGTNPLGVYTDKSHLLLLEDTDFPFVYAERPEVSPWGCSSGSIPAPRPSRLITNAQYSQGAQAFTRRIAEAVHPFLEKTDLGPFDTEVNIEGTISANGMPGAWRYEGVFDRKIINGLINSFINLPRLEPASVNGKAVEQKIIIMFRFNRGMYTVNYSLLPVTTN